MSESNLLDKLYDPREVEPRIYARWEKEGAFRAQPDDPLTPEKKRNTFTIVIPPPNVTGALHLGHALNNTLQDILIRYHRMRGFNTLWQPGTDHAGIATQAVVERRIREQEGKTRYQLGATEQESRDELVRRIWQWKDEYEKRIIGQLKLMGCSCDWGFREAGTDDTGRTVYECDGHRTRFTLDEGMSQAVREMFFRLFKDGLIFRGKRLVNWDTQLQTAVADDEVYHETVKGSFWHFRYPLIPIEPRASARADSTDEPAFVVIATTRPETLLGDTAVAVHPDPAGELDRREQELRAELQKEPRASARAELETRLAAIADRRQTHLPSLVTLSRMAHAGRKVMLPLVERPIPFIADEWADPMLGTGCVKITPAHDPNDYNVGLKHNLPMINVLSPDGKIARIMEDDGSVNQQSGNYEGLDFSTTGRAKVVADMESRGLVEKIEDREIEIGHSDRSKTPIEPFLSDQWFVRTADPNEPRASARADSPNEPRASARADGATQAGVPAPLRAPHRAPDLSAGAVLVTWTTYGTWLPGDQRGFVSRTPHPNGQHEIHNMPGEDYDADDPRLLASASNRRGGNPVWLDQVHANCVLRSLAGACERNAIELLAVAIMRNHVHVLCQCDRTGPELLQILKGNTARDLGKQFSLSESPRWWTKGGSTRFIKERSDLTAAMEYLLAQEVPLCLWRFDAPHSDVGAMVESARAEARGSLGLASRAMEVVQDGRIRVFPDRYAKSYLDWLGEKRDWCISRQLWWGHRIPVWSGTAIDSDRYFIEEAVPDWDAEGVKCGSTDYGTMHQRSTVWHNWTRAVRGTTGVWDLWHCVAPGYDDVEYELQTLGYVQDPDVLDTWFSSALWPFSTLGWPETTPHLRQYYPGSVLCTSRDIITNWVARMVMFGLYAMGEVPFDHVYIHPKILDGRGETMSKSKGNGVDPVDIIHTHGADALRYTMADMCTETQDIRLPVEYVCPHCGKLTDQSLAIKAEEQARKSRGEKLDRRLQPADCRRVKCANPECKQEFATQWADDSLKQQLKVARESSDKFDVGRNFCNKLWNAARFAFMNLEGASCDRLELSALPPEDRWILARLSGTIRRYHECIQAYQFSASVKELRDFFWDALCDWYVELTKPRMECGARDPVKQVLAFCLDQALRLWHPTIPFITERLWQQLNAIVPKRGLPGIAELQTRMSLILAPFPPVEGYAALDDPDILGTFAGLQNTTRGVRDLRSQCNVPPKETVTVTVVVPPTQLEGLRVNAHIVRHMANLGELHVVSETKRPRNAAGTTIGDLRIFLHDACDDETERTRTAKALDANQKQIEGKQSKLSNEKFVANAKPDVVQAERDRLAELIRERETLSAHLSELTS